MFARMNADDRMRRIQRGATPGSVQDLALLIRQRLRQGLISVTNVKNALAFSAPLGEPCPLGPSCRDYDWWPVATEGGNLLHNAAVAWGYSGQAPLEQFEQDPRTLALNKACRAVLPGFRPRSTRGRDLAQSAYGWAVARGFVIADTGSPDNHPPYEIQWDQNVEEDRIEAVQRKIHQDYVKATWRGPSDYGVDDAQYWWLVREGAKAGAIQPTRILRWLRYNSTVEYCAILGANVHGFFAAPSYLFGEGELDLVTTLLGGPF